ncbi:MotE family protein [Roseibium algae]|uniref:Flagellar motility protein MotE (MotC chaperone) n=1 Tax=Roseibium algae TaxID=3123038 RepID=A0ABU8TMN3_9HYPH
MNVRLLPLLAISASALLALKLLGLVMGAGPTVAPIKSAVAQEADADAATTDVPESEGDEESEGALEATDASDRPPPLPESLEIGGSAAERAVLESLGKRRQTLESEEGQLDLREKLLQATEERIQKRVDELKMLEKRIEDVVDEKRQQEDGELAALVTMYESMKPKDAARIFDRLQMPVLLKVVRRMNPRKMADVLGRMSSESAEKLTVAIANSAAGEEPQQLQGSNELPKIKSN